MIIQGEEAVAVVCESCGTAQWNRHGILGHVAGCLRCEGLYARSANRDERRSLERAR